MAPQAVALGAEWAGTTSSQDALVAMPATPAGVKKKMVQTTAQAR